MAVFLTGDLHLTARPSEGYRWTVFDFLLRQADKRAGDHDLILLGDVTDRKDLHPSRLVNRLVREFSRLRARFDSIRWVMGNHDYADPTEPFFSWVTELDGVVFHQTPDWIVLGGEGKALLLPNSKTPEQDWDKLKLPWDSANVVFMHQPLYGAETSNGSKIEEAKGLAKFLRSKTNAPIYSGDIHVPQVIGPVTYLGSPHPVHFGDTFAPRIGVLEDGKFISIPRKSVRLISTTVRTTDDLRAMDLRKGDHLKVQVALTRSEWGAWPRIRKDIANYTAKKGVELHGSSMIPLVAKDAALPKRGAFSAATAAHKPEATLDRFLAHTAAPDADKLAAVGLRLFQAAATDSPSSRKVGDITFGSLSVAGFKSVQSPLLLKFSGRQPGLYLVRGRNDVEPKLGANGVGKSTILGDAPAWCLWGKTPRGVFGPSVVSWNGSDPCQVSMSLRKEGVGRLRVTRTQKPNSLTLVIGDGQPITPTQEELNGYLGQSLDEFLLKELMSQFGIYFLDMSDTKRLEVFSRALGLGVWEGAVDVTSAALTELSERRESLVRSCNQAEGSVTSLEEALLRARTEVATSKEAAAKLVGKVDLPTLLDNLKGAQQAERSAQTKRDAQAEIVRSLVRKNEAALESLEAYRRGPYADARAAIVRAKVVQEAAANALAGVRTTGRCSVCLQNISSAQAGKIRKLAEAALAEAKMSTNLALEKMKLAEAEEAKQLAARKAVADQLIEARALHTKLVDRCTAAVKATAAASSAYHDGKALSGEATTLVERAKEGLERAKANLATAEEALAKARAALDALDAKIGPVKFWQQGFRNLRFWLISEALDELSIGASNALEQLGLVGWSISFDVERQTKSGDVSRGFHVFIQSPASPEQVPWESWSGGESQRLRLAVAVAVADLIGSRTGVRSNLEIYDEPTQHLSEEGVQDVLSFLSDRARDLGKQIWIMDHHSFAHGSFAGEYLVVKTKKGSRWLRVQHGAGE